MYVIPEDLTRLTSHAIVNDSLIRANPIEVRAEARKRMAIRLLNEAVCQNIQERNGVNETVFSVDFYLIAPEQLLDIVRAAMQEGAFDEIRRKKHG